MHTSHDVLIMGATYGSLLATKLLLAGHNVTLICLPAEAEMINKEGTRVRMPIRGRSEQVEIVSTSLPGRLSARGPGEVDPASFDLVALAMQEPQYGSSGVRELLDKVARSGVPCMSIMNMPPLPYLRRVPGIDADKLLHCYTEPKVWENLDPSNITLASPDPQAVRPPGEPGNFLQVTLPTNFKVARFESDEATAVLRTLQDSIEAVRFDANGESVELPVKIKVHESVYVPLAKWCMLLTGNYRCVQSDGMRAIKEAVHSDLDKSREVYEWVAALCRSLGASAEDQVPFEKYANAAQGLVKPSSAARALDNGAQNIERVDLIVKTLAGRRGEQLDEVDAIVGAVNSWLEKNRKAAA